MQVLGDMLWLQIEAMSMGLNPLVHLEGGFNKWLKQDGAIETTHKK